MQFIPIDSLVARVEIENASHLAIRTYIPASGHSMKSLGFENHKKALIVSPGGTSSWESLTLREHNKELVILGPWLEPKTFKPFSSYHSQELLLLLKLVIKVFYIARDLPEFQSDPIPGLLPLQDGSLLVLPRTWSQGILHHCSDQSIQLINHLMAYSGKNPDYIQTMGFFLGSLAYLWSTGEEPFSLEKLDQSDITELNERKRNGIYKPLGLFDKPIGKELMLTIDELIQNPTSQAIEDLESHLSLVSSYSFDQGSHYNPVELSKLEKKWNRTTKLFQLRRYVQQKRTFLLATTLAVILVVSVGTQMIQRVLTPPLSLGWAPDQVVTEFFQAANSLDAVTMDELVMDNGARELRRTVVHLFATSRVREAHEMRNPHIDAKDWVSEGKPEVPEAAMIFGIVDFEILEVTTGDQESRARVRYSLYMPDVQEIRSEDGTPATLTSYMVESIEEYIFLGKERSAWKIRLVERVL